MRVAIVDSGRSGVDVFDQGTTLTMTSSLITASRPAYAKKTMGVGMAIAMGGVATVKDSTILGNHHSGIYLWEGGALDITRTLIRGTKKEIYEDRLGHGILGLALGQVDGVGRESALPQSVDPGLHRRGGAARAVTEVDMEGHER